MRTEKEIQELLKVMEYTAQFTISPNHDVWIHVLKWVLEEAEG